MSKPIEYGSDGCYYCKMTIMDPRYAAESVTSKGKVYKFDAIECMVTYVNDRETPDFALLLVHDFYEPSDWLDVDSCTFFISEATPSPMGANLSALSDYEKAEDLQMSKGGELLSWNELGKKLGAEK